MLHDRKTFNPIHLKTTPMQMLIMIQLMEGPKYGYEILKNLQEDFQETWNPQTGTIYPALKSMMKKGLIKTQEINGQIFYHLSEKGNTIIQELEDYIVEIIFFSKEFIESILKRIPSKAASQMLDKLITTGITDLIPEKTLVHELNRYVGPGQRITVLNIRKKGLLEKLELIEKSLSECD